MAVILPGQEFKITYAEGQKLTVKALTGKQQQQEFGPLFQEVINAEVTANVVESIGSAKRLLDYIAGQEKADELWDTCVDASMVVDIARKLLERGRLDEDDEKKSESPH